MRYFRLRREYQIAYILIGLVFLGVSVSFWKAWGALPEGDPWTALYVVRNVTVMVLGFLLIARPWRSKLGIDAECIRYEDGILPARRLPLATVRAVFSNRGKRMVLYLHSGRQTYIEHTFEGLDEFLAMLAERDIPVLDKPLARNARR